MKKLVIAAGGIVIIIVAGFFLYRHFVINSIMDGPFMENITPDESEAEPEQKPESTSAQEPESASARETESTIARALPETAALMEFSWHQSAMNHDDCFDFWMKTTDQDPEQPYLYCSYTNPETRERIELGDEMFIYRAGRQKKAEPVPGGKSESGAKAEADIKSESGKSTETEGERCPRIPHERCRSWRTICEKQNSLHISHRTRSFSTAPTVSWSSPGLRTGSRSQKPSMADPLTVSSSCCRISHRGSDPAVSS